MSEEFQKNKKTDQEIDLIELIKTIWAGRKTIYKSVGICIIIGIIIVIGTPKEYKSEAKLLVETGSGTSGISGLLQQFGGLAGINMGANKGEDALMPMLYPDIIESTPFLLEVLDQKVQPLIIDTCIKFSKYLNSYVKPSWIGILEKYTLGLPGTIIGWIKSNKEDDTSIVLKENSGPLKLTIKQDEQMKITLGMIGTNQDEETGVLSISVQSQDPQISAELVDKIVVLLSQYIIEYRVQKAKVDLQFVEERHKEAEQRYKVAQKNLAYFRDQNQNVILVSAQTIEQNLQAEYNLAFNIYNTLSQQLEQSKMKVQEKTPVFRVMEPAIVPLRKIKPKPSIVLVFMILLGGFFGIGDIFINKYKYIFKQINS